MLAKTPKTNSKLVSVAKKNVSIKCVYFITYFTDHMESLETAYNKIIIYNRVGHFS